MAGPAVTGGAGGRIWLFAFGYFACYAPYSALTKALTAGLLPSLERPLTGFELLPSTVMASIVGMFVFLTAMRWWKHATHGELFGLRVPRPTRYTFLSGLCTAAIIGTTTLAYTFEGVSIVFVMLLMRGGVLIIAPIVDSVTKRKTRWFSWVGLALSLAALIVAFAERGGYDITLVCALDVALYLASYFVRLRFMTALAKSSDTSRNIRFFVEEQMVASPAMLLALAVMAFAAGPSATVAPTLAPMLAEVRDGFTTFWSRPVVMEALAVGFLSQGTGIFGGLILLDPSENTYSVPVNRCSSILAGVLASYGLTAFLGEPLPSAHQLAGAALIVVAILFLTLPPLRERARTRVASASAITDRR